MKRVSVVVPTFNQSQYLATCLDSIWFQSYENIEIILINDGSTDNTSQVIDDYLHSVENDRVSHASYYDEAIDSVNRTYYARYNGNGRSIKIIDRKQNKGLAATLNEGFKQISGEYCTYIPSDDICLPNMFAELTTIMEETGSDFSYGDMFIVDDVGRVLRQFDLPDYSYEKCFQDWYLCGLAKLYRSSLHEDCGFYDETLLAHDHALFMKFADAGARFVHSPKVLMSVRDHGQRQVDIHSPDNWSRLIEESKKLVVAAREK